MSDTRDAESKGQIGGDGMFAPVSAKNFPEEGDDKKTAARKSRKLPKGLQTEELKRFHINVPADDQKKIKILQIALEIPEDEVFMLAIRNLYKETILKGEGL